MVTPAPVPQNTNDPNFDPDVQPSTTIQAGWCGHLYAWKTYPNGTAVCTMKGCGATWMLS